MNSYKIYLISTAVLLGIIPGRASTEERPGKAVHEFSAENGMKITQAGLKNIEVKLAKIAAGLTVWLPASSVVYFQDSVGVYRHRQEWFKLVKVQILKKDNNEVLLKSPEFQPGDEVAVHGADLLRVSELDALGGGE